MKNVARILSSILSKLRMLFLLPFYFRPYWKRNRSIKKRLANAVSRQGSSTKYDIVVTWVDEDDPCWREKIKKYHSTQVASDNIIQREHVQGRNKDFHCLKYFLRSIEKYAWDYRKIFIVTDNPLPDYLRSSGDRLVVVPHESIIPSKALPVFNPCAIEANLHKIPDLLDRFVYFNDDIFLAKKVGLESFFFKSEVPINELAATIVQSHPMTNGFEFSSRNSSDLLDKDFKAEKRFFSEHAPHIFRKFLVEEASEKHKENFAQTSHSRFRSKTDLGVLNSLLIYYQHYVGHGLLAFPSLSQLSNLETENFLEFRFFIFKLLLKLGLTKKTFCVYDGKLNSEKDYQFLIDFLESLYPEKSSFEITAKKG